MTRNLAGLIRVTTFSPHGMATGDEVVITGVLGTTEANGTWKATNVGPTQFDLQGSIFVHPHVPPSGSADPPHRLTLFVAADEATNVELSGPEVATQMFPIAASSVAEIVYQSPTPQISTINAVDSEAIRVRSVDPLNPRKKGAPVAIYAFNRRLGSAGAYMALPVDVLGKEYRALSRPGISAAPGSQVTVVATKKNTKVSITTLVDTDVTTAGVPLEVRLDRFQTFLLRLGNGDLTGTLVTANKPIAVFSGNQNGTVSSNLAVVADHMVEQLPPVSNWGREFVVAPIRNPSPGDVNDTLRILAHQDGTELSVNGTPQTPMAAGSFRDFPLLPGGSWITTSKPVLVAQFNAQMTTTQLTGPFAMLVPPVNQFGHDYLFRTPGAPFWNVFPTTGSNWLNIVVKNRDDVNLLLNKLNGLPEAVPIPAWTPVTGSDYRYTRVSLSPATTYRLEHQEPSVRFGAWVYGHSLPTPAMGGAFGEGYGYAAGQELRKNADDEDSDGDDGADDEDSDDAEDDDADDVRASIKDDEDESKD